MTGRRIVIAIGATVALAMVILVGGVPVERVSPLLRGGSGETVSAPIDETIAPVTPPLGDSDEERSFRLDFQVDRERYVAGEPINAHAVLTYLGPDTVTLRGPGTGLIGFGVDQLDGPITIFSASTTDCAPHVLEAGRPMIQPFQKSGGFSPDDPNVEFFEAYFRDPVLRLPSGSWELVAGAGFYIGDCGPGDVQVSLTTSVRIEVE
ncbi:MAG: hypothetical protein ABR509_00880 [Candidatus Limnocylindria bacterium]